MSIESENAKAEAPITYIQQEERRDVWRIILPGLALLALLAIIVIIVMALVALIRLLVDPASFLLQQELFLIVMVAGLAAAIIAYTVTITRALRQSETWRRNGHTTKATAGLVAVTLVAGIIVLPVMLALFFH